MNPSDEVWNRACAEPGGPTRLTAAGDRALADMVLAHSLAMNGRLLNSIESVTPEARAAAVQGYRYVGLDAADAVFEDVAQRWAAGHIDVDAAERLEVEADERYNAVVLDDNVLSAAFKARYVASPEQFAPLD